MDDVKDSEGSVTLFRRVGLIIDYLISRPVYMSLVLGILGLIVRHAWLSGNELVAGDQGGASQGQLTVLFPWPTIWSPVTGLGGHNTFYNSFRFPVYELYGILANLGAHWGVIERLVYYVPFAVTLPIASWLLSREILGETRWTVLTPLITVGSTYFLVDGTTEVPLGLSAALCGFALYHYLRALRTGRYTNGIYVGLLLAVATAVDIRPVYLTVVVIIEYFVIKAIATKSLKRVGHSLGISAIAGGTFLGLQLAWIIPLVMYHGNTGLPIPPQPNFNIITYLHALTGTMPEWTGSTLTPLVEAPLNPLILFIPIIAFLTAGKRTLKPEYLWLLLCAVEFAFLSKTNQPPFGYVYDWLYRRIPGFNLFRDGSKFLFLLSFAYAILIPTALRELWGAAAKPTRSRRFVLARTQTQTRVVAVLGALIVTSLSVSNIVTLESGALRSTTKPIAQPASIGELSTVLAKDKTYGQVLWVGSSTFKTPDGQAHTFKVSSINHPVYSLSGQPFSATNPDYFQYFCPVVRQAYCYLNSSIFPSLVNNTGTRYIVMSTGTESKTPNGFPADWFVHQIQSMYGAPIHLGGSRTGLDVWRVRSSGKTILSSISVGEVHGGSWTYNQIAPTLGVLNIPAVYTQTLNTSVQVPVKSPLKNAIQIYPRLVNAYKTPRGSLVALSAQSTAGTLAVRVGNKTLELRRLAAARAGWSFYGPFLEPSSSTSVTVFQSPNAARPPSVLGPELLWNSSLKYLLTLPSSKATIALATVHWGIESGTGLVSQHTTNHYFELRRRYDLGWRLDGLKPIAQAQGLYNLYYLPTLKSPNLHFSYSSLRWEKLGLIVSSLWLLVFVAALIYLRRREAAKVVVEETSESLRPFTSIPAEYFAKAGWLFLVGAFFVESYLWFGIPSRFPLLSITLDPYSIGIYLAESSLFLFGVSVLVRIVSGALFQRERAKRTVRAKRKFALGGILALILSGCGLNTPTGVQQAISTAAVDGAPSPNLIGSSLDMARLDFTVRNAPGCIANYTIGIEAFPRIPSYYIGRGICYDTVQLKKAAEQDFYEALRITPTDPVVNFQVATALRRAGYVTQAAAQFLKLAELPNAGPNYLRLALQSLIGLDNRADEIKVTRLAEELFPADPLTHLDLADLAQVRGSEQEYLGQINAALAATSSAPKDRAQVEAYACQANLTLQRYQEAQAFCSAAVSDSNGSASGSFDNLAAVEQNLGNWGLAQKYIGEALGSASVNVGPTALASGISGFGLANLLQSQGLILEETGNIQGALQSFTKAISDLPPHTPNARQQLNADIKAIDATKIP
jgi:tetratricopeptide (TPR) repeat protein